MLTKDGVGFLQIENQTAVLGDRISFANVEMQPSLLHHPKFMANFEPQSGNVRLPSRRTPSLIMRILGAAAGYICGVLVLFVTTARIVADRRGVPWYDMRNTVRWFVDDSDWLIFDAQYGYENAILLVHGFGSLFAVLGYVAITLRWKARRFSLLQALLGIALVAAMLALVRWFAAITLAAYDRDFSLSSGFDVEPNAGLCLTLSALMLSVLMLYRFRLNRRRRPETDGEP